MTLSKKDSIILLFTFKDNLIIPSHSLTKKQQCFLQYFKEHGQIEKAMQQAGYKVYNTKACVQRLCNNKLLQHYASELISYCQSEENVPHSHLCSIHVTLKPLQKKTNI